MFGDSEMLYVEYTTKVICLAMLFANADVYVHDAFRMHCRRQSVDAFRASLSTVAVADEGIFSVPASPVCDGVL